MKINSGGLQGPRGRAGLSSWLQANASGPLGRLLELELCEAGGEEDLAGAPAGAGRPGQLRPFPDARAELWLQGNYWHRQLLYWHRQRGKIPVTKIEKKRQTTSLLSRPRSCAIWPMFFLYHFVCSLVPSFPRFPWFCGTGVVWGEKRCNAGLIQEKFKDKKSAWNFGGSGEKIDAATPFENLPLKQKRLNEKSKCYYGLVTVESKMNYNPGIQKSR